jgi:hypothetical protein
MLLGNLSLTVDLFLLITELKSSCMGDVFYYERAMQCSQADAGRTKYVGRPRVNTQRSPRHCEPRSASYASVACSQLQWCQIEKCLSASSTMH